jgi:hypothetical protein
MNTIEVPVCIHSLSAAIEARLPSLSLDSSPAEILALIALFDRVDDALDRLAAAAGVPVEA